MNKGGITFPDPLFFFPQGGINMEEMESSLKKLDNVIEKLKRDEEELRRLAKMLRRDKHVGY